MYELERDPSANRLYLSLTGRMDRAELEIAADETIETAERLREGFDVVTDLSGFKPPSPEAAKPIKRAQAELKEMGVDRVVRVADAETSQVVVNAFQRRSREVGYTGEAAESVLEAERKLDEEQVDGHATA